MTPRGGDSGFGSPRSSSMTSPTPCSSGSSSATNKNGNGSCLMENHSAGTECWLHEDCILWAPGVKTVNSQLQGLDEAVAAAQESVRTHEKRTDFLI